MNPILVISSDPDNTVEYLKQAGYDALPVYANDMALDMAKKNQSNTVLYYTTVGPVEHEHILKMLREAGLRIILISSPGDQVLSYGAAIGIYDILFTPVAPEEIISSLENPATAFDAAEKVKSILQQMDKEQEKEKLKKTKINIRLPFGPVKQRVVYFQRVAFSSLWSPGIGVTSTLVDTAYALARHKFSVRMFDCDIVGRGLGCRLGLEPNRIHDWRDSIDYLQVNDYIEIMPISPYTGFDGEKEFTPDRLRKALRVSRATSGFLLVDAGHDPLSWYAQQVMDIVDMVIWVTRNDPLVLNRAVTRWLRNNLNQINGAVLLLDAGKEESEVVKEFLQTDSVFAVPVLNGKKKRNKENLGEWIAENIFGIMG